MTNKDVITPKELQVLFGEDMPAEVYTILQTASSPAHAREQLKHLALVREKEEVTIVLLTVAIYKSDPMVGGNKSPSTTYEQNCYQRAGLAARDCHEALKKADLLK